MIRKEKIITNSFEDTLKFGSTFSKKLKPGNIVLLYGQLGSGKTSFVKGVAEGFGFKGEATSPTFSLINEYDARTKIIHIDCYREKNISRWINIGIIDYFESDSIVLIEWPEILEDIIPDDVFKIQFNHINGDKREINII